MKVAHRAKKNLDRLYGFEKLGPRKRETWARRLGLPAGDEICGLYRNDPGCSMKLLVVTIRGIHIKRGDEWSFVSYRDIQSVDAPAKDPEDRELLVGLESGALLRLPITGGRGRFKDVYGFFRFLRSAPSDKR